MTDLTLTFLGAFAVKVDDQPLTRFHSDKVRALLAYLALEPARPHQRTVLAALLWPEAPDRQALQSLRAALYHLRQSLDQARPGFSQPLLTSTHQALQFNTEAGLEVTVDALYFQTLVAACETHAHEQLYECESCLNRLKQAADLYRGELLAGFSLGDGFAFEEGLLLQREMLQQQALLTLKNLAEAYETQGDAEQAYRYASQLLRLDPYREGTHRQLMRLLAWQGLPDQALAQYASCRQLLADELGAEPEAETTALAEQIRRGELGGEATLRAQHRGGTRRISLAQAQEPKQEDKAGGSASPSAPPPLSPRPGPRLDWDERPLMGSFFGREPELAQLRHWLLQEGCRLVALLGIGGVGKTALAAQLIPTLAQQFELVLWRSLLNAPPLTELLRTLLPALSGQQLSDLPGSLDQQLSLLFTYLNQGRVLLVLDNMESIMQPGAVGQYRAGYEPYQQLVAGMATRHHQGQLLLTSREQPQGLNRLERDMPLVRVLSLSGLDEAASHQLLLSRGVNGVDQDEVTLNRRYSGNPLALKLVADTVQDLFFGDLREFLKEENLIFDDVRQVLDQQFGRLTKLEQELLFWLAVEREALPVQRLEKNLLEAGARRALLEALQGLQRRSLIEGQSNGTTPGFILQNVIAEYLTDRLVEAAVEELETGQLELLHRHALIKAQAKEYLRQSQVRLILNPIGERLLAKFGRIGLIDHLRQIIARLRLAAGRARSYAGGNLLNLLLQLEVDVSGYDFSQLSLWQVYLQGLSLPAVNFAGADLSGSLFSDNFGAICSLTFSPDGQLFAAAILNGEIRLWQTSGRHLVSHY